MYRIMIVEDDEVIARAVQQSLVSWGMDAFCVQDFSCVLAEFAVKNPQLVLMDIHLPFFNGFHWCQEIRKVSKVPVIFLSSASDNMNIIMAVNMGGDDFIAKPFDLSVLTAKVQAMLRRTYEFAGETNFLEHRGAMLDTGSGVLNYRGKRIELTKNEWRILQSLLENKGKAVSRDMLMMHLWESDSFIDDNTLTVNVTRLRKKLEEAGLTDFIQTKKGVGYLIAWRKQNRRKRMEQQKEGIRQEFMLLNWYLKEHLASAVRIAAFIGVFSLLCFLRNVPQDVTVYMIVLMAAVGAAGFCFHYGKYRKHHLVLALLAAEPQGKTEALPEADGLLARDYQQIIASYERQFQEEQIKMEQKYRDMMEYYTMWTHQIKTPIAAMRLLLQEEDTPLSREMQSELFQTEQYVQMALQYLRMEKMTSDLVFARYDLDALIRQAVRKYAPLFIRRKIILSYEPVHCEVLTDEKWLVFVLEQILSNALKYTKSGSIHIYLSPDAPKTLVIEDTGIGIAPEDLPRIFEKGYTGCNGRADKRSTGIGLYLCRQIMEKLSHTIRIESEMGVGTKVYLGLDTVSL